MPKPKNAGNLKPNAARTPEQLKNMGRKGGKASGEARKKRKAAKDIAKLVLGMNVQVKADTKRTLKKLGYDVDAEGAPSVELLMQIAIANQAIAGDIASARFIYDYAQIPDIHVALERERIKAQAEARSRVDLNVTGDADCLAEIRERMAEERNQESGTRNQESGTRNQEPGTRNQESGTRNQESGTRNQESGTSDGRPFPEVTP